MLPWVLHWVVRRMNLRREVEPVIPVRLTGSVFLHARFTAPFGVISPRSYDEQTPLAHLRHISAFHLIVAGGCTFETATGERREVTAGELLLLPFADHHKFWKGEPSEMAAAGEIVQPAWKVRWTSPSSAPSSPPPRSRAGTSSTP